jgi:PhzF family phenazine biosynthesis protein
MLLLAEPVPVSIINACLRKGRGGSPTAVLYEGGHATRPRSTVLPAGTLPAGTLLTDAERGRVPVRFGTSHAVFVTRREPHDVPGAPIPRDDPATTDEPAVDLRFFTADGELPACGHGTIAAIAFLALQRGCPEHEFRLRVSGRTFTGHALRVNDRIHAAFDPGRPTLRDPTSVETDRVVDALGLAPDSLAAGARVASLGRARMLVPVATPESVATLAPHRDRLRAALDQLGLLGCYVYSAPTSTGRVVARMFAPSIGVPEDIANANSTACLAAHLAERGVTDLTVDMGDALGSPATITTTIRPGPTGPNILVGGSAIIAHIDTR